MVPRRLPLGDDNGRPVVVLQRKAKKAQVRVEKVVKTRPKAQLVRVQEVTSVHQLLQHQNFVVPLNHERYHPYWEKALQTGQFILAWAPAP